ncbi:MAG: NAD(P)H-dependent oxidoreductase [Schwartzia sp.]|nr:NAD(P)H-dependent oxidoreductase [Schwartzia sp. (in: firmicutes)]
MSKKLVAYFSASGVTAKVAKDLAGAAGADLYEIRPETLYTDADLNWRDKSSRSSVEMQSEASRPALADKSADVAGHDVIFVGFPIWWYTAPAIVRTFMEAYDFSGKKVILFATSGGSGFGKAAAQLSACAPKAEIREGKLLNGSPSATELAAWVESLDV